MQSIMKHVAIALIALSFTSSASAQLLPANEPPPATNPSSPPKDTVTVIGGVNYGMELTIFQKVKLFGAKFLGHDHVMLGGLPYPTGNQ